MARPRHSRKRRGHTKADVPKHTVDAQDPRFNVALARGIAVLRAFDVDDQFLGNTEIAARIAVPKHHQMMTEGGLIASKVPVKDANIVDLRYLKHALKELNVPWDPAKADR